ncbi:hypothetical protein ATCVMN08101_746L [Acanthocystis turfacea Chlorella virus MN0810.1]|nr:hypothetical protein ATCVMN08101_746L [Acanthocystis turfacea Chlorella virus MN0810.1]
MFSMADVVKMLSKKFVTFDNIVVVHMIPLEGNKHPIPRGARNPDLKTYKDVQAEVVRRRWFSAERWREAFEDQKDYIRNVRQEVRNVKRTGGNATELEESIETSVMELSLLLSLKWHYNVDRIDPRDVANAHNLS